METNEILKEQIIQIIDNQLKSNNPPETKKTLERLIQLGYTDSDAKLLIGQCLSVELFNVLKYQKPYDPKRYLKNLSKLPEEPFDD
jgi:hypothetical protein